MSPIYFFFLVLKASLLSTGGFGNLPAIHDDLVPRGWATDRQFGASLAVGNTSPGPNGLWVVSIGYLLAGLTGAAVATLAIAIPPFLVLWVERIHERHKEHPAMDGFVRGLSIAVVGLFVVKVLAVLAGNGINTPAVILAIAGFALGNLRRLPTWLVIAGGAAAGIAVYTK